MHTPWFWWFAITAWSFESSLPVAKVWFVCIIILMRCAWNQPQLKWYVDAGWVSYCDLRSAMPTISIEKCTIPLFFREYQTQQKYSHTSILVLQAACMIHVYYKIPQYITWPKTTDFYATIRIWRGTLSIPWKSGWWHHFVTQETSHTHKKVQQKTKPNTHFNWTHLWQPAKNGLRRLLYRLDVEPKYIVWLSGLVVSALGIENGSNPGSWHYSIG